MLTLLPNIQIKETPIPVADPEPPIIQAKVEVSQPEPRKYWNVELTGYDNCYKCTKSGKGITASGKTASRGTIAVPKSIPLGTEFIINGVKHRAEDRGGAIQIHKDGTWIIDVWFPSHNEALKFGRVKAKMYQENGVYYIEY